ncbi:MAG TPA: hypothetical protein VK070_05375 [Acidimicrobiia bacterium]|nr:hypothetical protein [Acidimicrobiia bacterium]
MKNKGWGLQAIDRRDGGASLVEYSLLLVLVALVAWAAVASLGTETSQEFEAVAESFQDFSPGSGVQTGHDENDEDTGQDAEDDQDEATDQGQDTGNGPGNGNGQGNGNGNGNGNENGQGNGNNNGTDQGTDPAEDEFPGLSAGAESAEFYWWDDHNDEGQWVAGFQFSNTTDRHQYLTLEVTRTLADGTTTTEIVRDHYVGAKSSSTFRAWHNDYGTDRSGKQVDGDSVVSIQVTVTSVKTSDENWKEYTVSVTGPTLTVDAPPLG